MKIKNKIIVGFLILVFGLLSFNACGSITNQVTATVPLPAVSETMNVVIQTPVLTNSLFLSPTIPTATFTPSPTISPTPWQDSGCQKPPDDYTIINVNGYSLNARTYAMLQHAAEIYGGTMDITGSAITQGSYSSAVSASFGTHDGGGAVDLSVLDDNWMIAHDEIEPLLHALRVAGFAAWLRDLDELYPGSPIHIHAIAIGDQELSAAAQEQVTGETGYFNGNNGIPVDKGGPIPDRYGGPIFCQWMLDLGSPYPASIP